MRKVYILILRFILGLLIFLIIFSIFMVIVFSSAISGKESTIPKESDCMFQLPQKEIFVKTSKLQGGRFVIYFAPDSLSLNNSKDFIEYRTGAYPQIIVDTTDIYVNSQYRGARLIKTENGDYKFEDVTDSIFYNNSGILSIRNANLNFRVVSDSVFHSFFENNIQKYPYSFISIDTKLYSIYVNQQEIKKGDIHGGW